MGLLKTLLSRFQKQCETTEDHTDEKLRTHYYKANNKQVFDSIESLLRNKSEYKIVSVSKEHGELAVESVKGLPYLMIVTVISVKPFETAVDFNISTDKFLLSGSYITLKREALSLYEEIGRKYPYIGSGRHA